MKQKPRCAVPKCKHRAKVRGLCAGHARRYYKGVRGEALLRPLGHYGKGVPAEVAQAIDEARE